MKISDTPPRSLDTPRSLETVEEVAEIISQGIEDAKTIIAYRLRKTQEREDRTRTWNPSGYDRIHRHDGSISILSFDKKFEDVPNGEDKGVILRFDPALKNINVPGMTPRQAIEAALSQICGEPREATADCVDKNPYIVRVEFVTINGKAALPTLLLGKVESSSDALRSVAEVYENMLADEAYFSDPGANIHSSDRSVEERRAYLSSKKAEIEAKLREVKASAEDPALPPLAFWSGGLTDMSVTSQLHALCQLPNGPVHMIDLPKAEKSGLEKDAIDTSQSQVSSQVGEVANEC